MKNPTKILCIYWIKKRKVGEKKNKKKNERKAKQKKNIFFFLINIFI